jgi:hypothetical protein
MKKILFFLVFVMMFFSVNAQRTPIKVVDLQKSISDNISINYVGFVIKGASKVVDDKVTNYEVIITKGTTRETLLYDNDGKFLKKMAIKRGSIEKKVGKPIAKIPPQTVKKK